MATRKTQTIDALPVHIGEVVFDEPVTTGPHQPTLNQAAVQNALEAVGMALTQAPAGFWLLIAAGAFGLALLTDNNSRKGTHHVRQKNR